MESKRFLFIKPIDLSQHEKILFNSTLNKLQIIKDAPKPHEEAGSPKNKGGYSFAPTPVLQFIRDRSLKLSVGVGSMVF